MFTCSSKLKWSWDQHASVTSSEWTFRITLYTAQHWSVWSIHEKLWSVILWARQFRTTTEWIIARIVHLCLVLHWCICHNWGSTLFWSFNGIFWHFAPATAFVWEVFFAEFRDRIFLFALYIRLRTILYFPNPSKFIMLIITIYFKYNFISIIYYTLI